MRQRKAFRRLSLYENGVIFVTCNYRLGPFDSAPFPELAKRDGHSGNYGLYDQLTALQWIYHNIKDFGGNAENITLMGQSAGAMSVQQLCTSPLAKQYIAKAIMTSGGGISNSFVSFIPEKEAYSFWSDVTAQLGATLDDWLNAPAKDVISAMSNTAASHKNAGLCCVPVLDDHLVCYDLNDVATQKVQASVPYIMGSTKDDLFADVLADMAKSWVIQQSSQNMKPPIAFTWSGIFREMKKEHGIPANYGTRSALFLSAGDHGQTGIIQSQKL